MDVHLQKVRPQIPKTDKQGGSQTVDRALEVLVTVAGENRPISLDELATDMGLHKSVVYRLLRSFENAGFVARDPLKGGYSVAATLLSLSVRIASRVDMRATYRPAMEEIVRRFGETASLHIRSHDQRVCVEVVEGTHSIRRVVPVGERLPVFAGETGRALLSQIPDGELQSLLLAAGAAGLDTESLRNDIALVRRQGWFIGLAVRTPDVGAISIPLAGPANILGALTISGPASRWHRPAMEAAMPTILEILQPIKPALGESG